MDPNKAGLDVLLSVDADRIGPVKDGLREIREWLARGGFRPSWPEISAAYKRETGDAVPLTPWARNLRRLCEE